MMRLAPRRTPAWSPSRAREELRAALGRAEEELGTTPPTTPAGAARALARIAMLRRALIEDRVVNTPAALRAWLAAVGREDEGLVALLEEQREMLEREGEPER